MNLNLIDPFILAQDYPETPAASLRSGHATTVRFNRKGDLLASGRADGLIVVFDVETNGVARKLRAHTKSITSLSWSGDGRYLLSSGQDWRVVLWDLGGKYGGGVIREVRLDAACYVAEMHPYNPLMFIAALFEESALLVDMRAPSPIKTKLSSTPKRPKLDEDDSINTKQAAQDAKNSTTSMVWSGNGQHILAGTNKGWLNIIDVGTCEIIYSTKLAAGIILHMRLTASGRDLLLSATDRVIRTAQLPNLAAENLDPDEIHIEIEMKFQDLVNRLSYNGVSFSATGEYITATTYNNHDIYIWERTHGSLVKLLEGPKEEHGSIDWHPSRPLIAACGLETGRIHMWSVVSPQRWSALAPDFVEVTQNVDYIEYEDEFDIIDEEEQKKRQLDLENEDVDVLTIEPAKGEIVDHEHSFKLPVLLDLDDSESEEEFEMVGAGTMRRRDPNENREMLADASAALGSSGVVASKRAKKGGSKKK